MNLLVNEIIEIKVCKFNLDYLIFIFILFVVIFVLFVVENILVFVVIVVDRRLCRFFNGYLLSLVFIDICILVGLILLEMIYVWFYLEWFLGFREIYVFNLVWFFLIVGLFVVVLVIIVDCYRVVLFFVCY